MFRADESSMYEDKNLPVSNCYSPSKSSKFGPHKFGGHYLQHHQSNLSTQGGGPSSSPMNILAIPGPHSFAHACQNDQQFKGLMPMMVEDFVDDSVPHND